MFWNTRYEASPKHKFCGASTLLKARFAGATLRARFLGPLGRGNGDECAKVCLEMLLRNQRNTHNR